MTLAIRVLGKGNKERRLFADGGFEDALRIYMRLRGSEPGPFLVRIDRWGHPHFEKHLTPDAIHDILERIAKGSDVERDFTPHDLRRTFATELWENGTDPKAIQDTLGHASLTTTAIYDRRGERAVRKAMQTVDVPFGRGKRR